MFDGYNFPPMRGNFELFTMVLRPWNQPKLYRHIYPTFNLMSSHFSHLQPYVIIYLPSSTLAISSHISHRQPYVIMYISSPSTLLSYSFLSYILSPSSCHRWYRYTKAKDGRGDALVGTLPYLTSYSPNNALLLDYICWPPFLTNKTFQSQFCLLDSTLKQWSWLLLQLHGTRTRFSRLWSRKHESRWMVIIATHILPSFVC